MKEASRLCKKVPLAVTASGSFLSSLKERNRREIDVCVCEYCSPSGVLKLYAVPDPGRIDFNGRWVLKRCLYTM